MGDQIPPGEGASLGGFPAHWIALQMERSLPPFARWHCGAARVSKYEAKEHSLGVGIDGLARGWYIQQDNEAFYGITSSLVSVIVISVMLFSQLCL